MALKIVVTLLMHAVVNIPYCCLLHRNRKTVRREFLSRFSNLLLLLLRLRLLRCPSGCSVEKTERSKSTDEGIKKTRNIQNIRKITPNIKNIEETTNWANRFATAAAVQATAAVACTAATPRGCRHCSYLLSNVSLGGRCKN